MCSTFTQIEVLNVSKEIAAAIYLSSVMLAVVIIVSVVLADNLTIYSATYAYGTALVTTAVLIIVFFTKVYDAHTIKYRRSGYFCR